MKKPIFTAPLDRELVRQVIADVRRVRRTFLSMQDTDIDVLTDVICKVCTPKIAIVVVKEDKNMIRPSLVRMIEASKRWWQNATQEERDKMIDEQRRSFVRGQMSMGSDRDEAEYAQALRDGDVEWLKRLDQEAAERAARVR